MAKTKEEEKIELQIESLKKRLPKKTRKPKKLPVVVSGEEFIRLIKATKKMHHKLAFLLGFGSGMRISEIVGDPSDNPPKLPLEPKHINLQSRSILIVNGKGGKDRVVPLPKGFKEEHLKLLPIRVGIRALEIAFKRSCRRAGLLETKPSLHFHSLRGGFATQAIKSGIPIHHVRTLMGHSNISTTNVYLEANPQDALKSYEGLF